LIKNDISNSGAEVGSECPHSMVGVGKNNERPQDNQD
jgi:hypothetical protein